MRTRFVACVLSLVATTAVSALAEPLDPSLLVGSWKLTKVYDQFSDGRRRETWGSAPQGILQFTANGIMSVQLSGGERPAHPGTVPTDPVGPYNAYFGTYTVDAAGRFFEAHVQRSSWPQWNGATLKRTIEELSSTTLKVVSAPINDPNGGVFEPHLEFERIK
ncbi:lipocalin-like domain-containing protein [Methylobacterium sp. NEAU K]|uniref:lipocalin-like domain-containing protein n=1 Tax=Methylobacterium sp. NEAU K TaxID=3064946 RepID=UPI0027347EED|nr:lipocalin-like domain-containing protein [Methylobacterium sp. NEAU K]MDP4006828.1 lipocalin-like domain-containing protein [Methylobacterium sp. NEAU K]